MIWFLLAITPFAVLVVVGLVKDAAAMLITIGIVVCVCGLVLLGMYGGWQMGWFNHCGDFWESAHCSGKVITR